MKIIILGAGQVGHTLAEHLLSERHDVTLVDINADQLMREGEKFDLRTIKGHASYPEVLQNAGAEDADMLIAVTASDEVNMLACQIAHFVFKTPTKIARVRALEYMNYPHLFDDKVVAVDVVINPEQLLVNYMKRLIEYPGALQVLDFANGSLELVVIKALKNAPLVGKTLSQLHAHLPSVVVRIIAISRAGVILIPNDNTVIEAEDEIYFITEKDSVRAINSEFRGVDAPYHNIMIAGAGNIGLGLAQALEDHYSVKIINRSEERCQIAAAKLTKAMVLQGNATDEDLLFNENIQRVDIFCALTSDDEINLMSAVLAKRMGARKVIALMNRQAYVDLIMSHEIDIIISPQYATVSNLLSHIRRGDIVQVHTLRRGAAEALEAIVHGTYDNSFVVGRTIAHIESQCNASIGAVLRNEKMMSVYPELIIETNDHVILFAPDKRDIPKIERLFQVRLSFF